MSIGTSLTTKQDQHPLFTRVLQRRKRRKLIMRNPTRLILPPPSLRVKRDKPILETIPHRIRPARSPDAHPGLAFIKVRIIPDLAAQEETLIRLFGKRRRNLTHAVGERRRLGEHAPGVVRDGVFEESAAGGLARRLERAVVVVGVDKSVVLEFALGEEQLGRGKGPEGAPFHGGDGVEGEGSALHEWRDGGVDVGVFAEVEDEEVGVCVAGLVMDGRVLWGGRYWRRC